VVGVAGKFIGFIFLDGIFRFFGCSFNPNLQYNTVFGDFSLPSETQKWAIKYFLFDNWPIVRFMLLI
jgi:hypothetical protein